MSDAQNIIGGETLGRLAEDNGMAIAIVDDDAHQVVVSNNNSICRHLNPGNTFSPACAKFCGKALEKALEAGGMIGFECHAGLDCRAIPSGDSEKRFVAIVGRTFLKAENYRKATERAITGDWSEFPPAEFFENTLLSGSSDALTKTAEQVELLINETRSQQPILANSVKQDDESQPTTEPEYQENEVIVASEVPVLQSEISEPYIKKAENRNAEAQAWRSFFGSILKTDYAQAIASILEFIAHQYGLTALVWLEKSGDNFENSTTFGEMKNRKVRIGILPDDQRLVEAYQNEMPLELGERSEESTRVMNLFPIGVGGDISAAVAILDSIDSDVTKRQIARICHSIAPQLEILRLRSEVSGRDAISNAIRLFGESLKGIDMDDFWETLTRNAAEVMRAERASLLIKDEKSGRLDLKALIGARNEPVEGEEIGGRVARIVFAKNEAVVVSDVAQTSLPPAPAERKYKTPSFLSCPINIGSRTIGVVSFTDRVGGEAFDKTSLDFFQALAPQIAVAIDRATLKEKAGEFEQLSVTDVLTGLLNRRYMEERLSEEIKRSNRHGFPMSFMMLDVDHFKSYNDEYGHPAGDVALKIVASVIRETLRSADVAARFGGEEFSILLPQTTAEEASAIAERLRSNIEHADFPHRLVTTSIGVASCSAELCASADLVSAADKALYEAKRQGRNRVRTFEEMNASL
ncbi:MAG: diguanylate cyclase [Chloracidobacterium sp.]|nr:diguanylate cyclase [Chloracidobacterium sp.]